MRKFTMAAASGTLAIASMVSAAAAFSGFGRVHDPLAAATDPPSTSAKIRVSGYGHNRHTHARVELTPSQLAMLMLLLHSDANAVGFSPIVLKRP